MLESLAAWEQVLCLANRRQQPDEHEHPDVLDSESIARSVDNAAVIGRPRGCAILVQQSYSWQAATYSFSMLYVSHVETHLVP